MTDLSLCTDLEISDEWEKRFGVHLNPEDCIPAQNENMALRGELNKALREIVDLRMPISGAAQASRDALIEQCAQIAMKHGDRLEIHSQRIADAIRSLNGTAVSSTDRILVTKSSGCVFCDIGVPPLDGIHYAEGEEIPCPLSSTESNSP